MDCSGQIGMDSAFDNGKTIPLVIVMFRKKDSGIGVGTKKRFALGTFF
jgi:hypothetical protein